MNSKLLLYKRKNKDVFIKIWQSDDNVKLIVHFDFDNGAGTGFPCNAGSSLETAIKFTLNFINEKLEHYKSDPAKVKNLKWLKNQLQTALQPTLF